MMKKQLSALAVLLTPALALAAEGQSAAASESLPSLSEGLWEITLSLDAPNLPANLPTHTGQQCFTKEDLAKVKNMVPPEQQNDCKLEDTVVSGKSYPYKLTWKMVCKGTTPSTGQGEIVLESATSFRGSQRSELEGVVMTDRFSASRVGNCE